MNRWAIVAAFLGSVSAAGQAIPASLKPALEERIHEFTSAQSSGEWNKVAELFGPVFVGGDRYAVTPEIRSCLVEQQKLHPLLFFTMKTYGFSSEIYEFPAEMKWWFLSGDGVMRRGHDLDQSPMGLLAYRDKGQWYFHPTTPDEEFARTRMTDADYAVDHASEIVVDIPPGAPIALSDLRAFVSRDSPDQWDVSYTLTNMTTKRIRYYDKSEGYTFHDGSMEEAGSIWGANDIKLAGDHAQVHDQFRPHPFECSTEVRTYHVRIDRVFFEDGTEWTAPGVKSSAEIIATADDPGPQTHEPRDFRPRMPR